MCSTSWTGSMVTIRMMDYGTGRLTQTIRMLLSLLLLKVLMRSGTQVGEVVLDSIVELRHDVSIQCTVAEGVSRPTIECSRSA